LRKWPDTLKVLKLCLRRRSGDWDVVNPMRGKGKGHNILLTGEPHSYAMWDATSGSQSE